MNSTSWSLCSGSRQTSATGQACDLHEQPGELQSKSAHFNNRLNQYCLSLQSFMAKINQLTRIVHRRSEVSAPARKKERPYGSVRTKESHHCVSRDWSVSWPCLLWFGPATEFKERPHDLVDCDRRVAPVRLPAGTRCCVPNGFDGRTMSMWLLPLFIVGTASCRSRWDSILRRSWTAAAIRRPHSAGLNDASAPGAELETICRFDVAVQYGDVLSFGYLTLAHEPLMLAQPKRFGVHRRQGHVGPDDNLQHRDVISDQYESPALLRRAASILF